MRPMKKLLVTSVAVLLLLLVAGLVPSAFASDDTTSWSPPANTDQGTRPPDSTVEVGKVGITADHGPATSSWSSPSSFPTLTSDQQANCALWDDPQHAQGGPLDNAYGWGIVLYLHPVLGWLVKAQNHIDCSLQPTTSLIIDLHRAWQFKNPTNPNQHGFDPVALDHYRDYEIAGFQAGHPGPSYDTWYLPDSTIACHPSPQIFYFRVAQQMEMFSQRDGHPSVSWTGPNNWTTLGAADLHCYPF